MYDPHNRMTTVKIRPGLPGTKKLCDVYGSQLMCVRYRYDPHLKRRLKTVELIVDEARWRPRRKAEAEESAVVHVEG